MTSFTDILSARPTLLEGAARLIDFDGTLDDIPGMPTGEDADRIALASDWYQVGRDMREAIEVEALRTRKAAEFVRQNSEMVAGFQADLEIQSRELAEYAIRMRQQHKKFHQMLRKILAAQHGLAGRSEERSGDGSEPVVETARPGGPTP